MKRCSACRVELPEAAFRTRLKRGKLALRPRCNVCEKALDREAYAAAPEKGRARMALYRARVKFGVDVLRPEWSLAGDRAAQRAAYAANPAVGRAKAKGWRNANPEKARAVVQKHYRSRPREYWAVRDRAYTASHPERHRMNGQARRLRRLGTPTGVRLSAAQWRAIVEYFGGRCAYCGAAQKLQIEHVVALARGGAHRAENVVPACGACNTQKWAKGILTMVNVPWKGI